MQALLVSCLLNAAQCSIKVEDWRGCEASCTRVLQLEKKSVKALFRRGVARSKLGDYGDAQADLRKANELDPKSREIREAFEECVRAQKDSRQASKAFYASTKVASGGYEAPPAEEEPKQFVC